VSYRTCLLSVFGSQPAFTSLFESWKLRSLMQGEILMLKYGKISQGLNDVSRPGLPIRP